LVFEMGVDSLWSWYYSYKYLVIITYSLNEISLGYYMIKS